MRLDGTFRNRNYVVSVAESTLNPPYGGPVGKGEPRLRLPPQAISVFSSEASMRPLSSGGRGARLGASEWEARRDP